MPKAKPTEDPEDLTISAPLAQLVLSPMNARATEPSAEDIATLAASIEACGLMQNLLGYVAPGDTSGKIEIVAGGRRLRALQLLASQPGKQLRAANPYVPVQVTHDRDMAMAWAMAENTGRTALHPADEIQAYRRMMLSGSDPNAIARAFAVTERHVRQRLKLALLPDPVIAALRGGKISLDQAAAFTIARTAEDAEAVLQKVLTTQWRTDDREIRAMLSRDTVRASDRRAVFVGLDAYEAAGGDVQRDLFTDAAFLEDAALLDRLFEEKLTAAVQDELATGWGWVKGLTDSYADYALSSGMQRIYRVPVQLPEADLEEMSELREIGNRDELTDAQAERLDELEDRAAGDFTDEDRAQSGLWLYVDGHGNLSRHGPFKPPVQEEPKAEDGIQKVEEKPVSQAVAMDLHKIQLAALQFELADSPSLALDLLAWQMEAGLAEWQRPIRATFTFVPLTPEKAEGFNPIDGNFALDRASAQRADATVASFLSFRAKGSAYRDAILALAAARSLTKGDMSPWLAHTLQPDPRRFWTPTKEGYFSRIAGGHLDAIWANLVPDDREPSHAQFRALKKPDKAQHLHRLFNDADFRELIGLSREENRAIDTWIPAEMAWPDLEEEPVARAAE